MTASPATPPKPFNPDDVVPGIEGSMVTYKTEVLSTLGWTSAQGISKQVQARLDAFAAGGWRMSGMASIAGTGGFFGGGGSPSLVMGFEHE